MRRGARLARAKFTPLFRFGSASRTTDGKHVFWAEFFFRHKPPARYKRPICLGLRFIGDGHGPTLQKGGDKFAIYL
jgi:hypothetical protein